MRQLAWLNTRPRSVKEKPDPDEEVPTRFDKMRADRIDPAMPPVSPILFENPLQSIGHPVMVDWLLEIGPTEAAGMGAAVISWNAIKAWQEITGVDLNPWQGKLLRRLSGDWLSQSDKARAPDCPAPYLDADGIRQSRSAVDGQLRRAFGGPPPSAERRRG